MQCMDYRHVTCIIAILAVIDMVPAKVTPRRVLWLAGACLLLFPAFASAAERCPGGHGAAAPAYHSSCHRDIGPAAGTAPPHRNLDDNDAESDDLIGDGWIAPCALPQCGALHSVICGVPDERQPYRSPACR